MREFADVVPAECELAVVAARRERAVGAAVAAAVSEPWMASRFAVTEEKKGIEEEE